MAFAIMVVKLSKPCIPTASESFRLAKRLELARFACDENAMSSWSGRGCTLEAV